LPASGSENKACSVGSYLRESRESRGITLEEAARVTRIGKNYLSALEDDRFNTLPNSAYAKGFLRAYASFLKLSGDEVIALYERAASPAVLETLEHAKQARFRGDDRTRGPRQGRWIVPLLLLFLVIGATYIFRDKETGTARTPSAPSVLPVTAGPAPVQKPRSSAVKPMEQVATHADKANGDPVPAGVELQPGGIVLKLKINQDSSLNVTIDGMISQQYELKAGDLIEWKADKVIALEMGNAGGIDAELNGKPLRPFGELGKTAHVVLRADTSLP
jgi:cytoskeleton protein RodZ